MKILDAELILNNKFEGLTVVVGECGSGKSAFMKTMLANEILKKPDLSILCLSENKMEYIKLIRNIVLSYGNEYSKNLKINFVELHSANSEEVIKNLMNDSTDQMFDICIADGLAGAFAIQTTNFFFRKLLKMAKKTFATMQSRKRINYNVVDDENFGINFGISHLASCIIKIQRNNTMSLRENYVAEDLYSISFIKNRARSNSATLYLSLDADHSTLYLKPKNSEKNFFNLPQNSIINYNEVFLPAHSNINKFFESISATKKIKQLIYSKAIIKLRDENFFINYDILLLAEISHCLSNGNMGVFQQYLNSINYSEHNLLINISKVSFLQFANQLSSKLKKEIFTQNNAVFILINAIYMNQNYINEYGVNLSFTNKKTIKDVHDFLQIRTSEIKYNHIVIEQQQKIERLNGLVYGKLTFKVPFDHKEVIAYGTKMHICVGATSTYFEKIQKGQSFIAFCIDENGDPQVCIELTHRGEVVQIKGVNNDFINEQVECDIKLTIGGLFCH